MSYLLVKCFWSWTELVPDAHRATLLVPPCHSERRHEMSWMAGWAHLAPWPLLWGLTRTRGPSGWIV